MTKNLSIYGAIIGDYYGSYWEFRSNKPYNKADALKLREGCHEFTDDTIMTLAVADAVCKDGDDLAEEVKKSMQHFGRKYDSSYGGSFRRWLWDDLAQPYNSWGNGSAMRVSPIGLATRFLKDVKGFSDDVTGVSHNHQYSLFYAGIVAEIVWMSKNISDNENDKGKEEIWNLIVKSSPELAKRLRSMRLSDLHRDYWFNETSQDTVPQAIWCFLNSTSFEDCLFKSLYIGGDSDTLAAISCSMAAPFYGDEQVQPFVEKLPDLPKDLKDTLDIFTQRFLR